MEICNQEKSVTVNVICIWLWAYWKSIACNYFRVWSLDNKTVSPKIRWCCNFNWHVVHSETARCLTPTVGASKSKGREGSQSKDFKRYPVQSSPRIIWGLSCDISLCHLIARSAQGLLFAIELFLCSWFTCELHYLSILCSLLSQLAVSNFSVVRKPKWLKARSMKQCLRWHGGKTYELLIGR